jgi:hypothetical protein
MTHHARPAVGSQATVAVDLDANQLAELEVLSGSPCKQPSTAHCSSSRRKQQPTASG